MDNLIPISMMAGVIAIGFTDTLGGFALRSAITLPLYLCGLIDAETAQAFVIR